MGEKCINTACLNESQFLLQRSDGRVCSKQLESMNPSCLVQAAGVTRWGISSCHTLDTLVPNKHNLNTTAHPSILADHLHPTVYSSPDDSFQQDNTTCYKLKSSQTGF